MDPADRNPTIELDMAELREVTRYAVACAEPALTIFHTARPEDERPRVAIDAARAFADGAERTKAIRDAAWDAHRAYRAARETGQAAASEAARAAAAAAGAAFLHPLAKATQVLHILGSAAHAARSFELAAGDDRTVGAEHMTKARILAGPVVVAVLMRYPNAPAGHGRVGELARELDASLRCAATGRQPITEHRSGVIARRDHRAGPIRSWR
ncbi:putative immunity protein [Nocardia paucivorans]|uniref:putative immunity protein n=1 Tax=Nocardia paucivorans TaxID=114259 RepID=UPI0002E1879B|nr:exonuclease SbcC [Nocardia paucivorans]